MNDPARITDQIAAKQRELVEFVVDTAGHVTNADMSDIDRRQVAWSLLGLIAKGWPAPAPIVIDHVPSEPVQEIAPPKPKKATAVKDLKPKVGGNGKKFTDRMVADALAPTTSVTFAAKKLGSTVTNRQCPACFAANSEMAA